LLVLKKKNTFCFGSSFVADMPLAVRIAVPATIEARIKWLLASGTDKALLVPILIHSDQYFARDRKATAGTGVEGARNVAILAHWIAAPLKHFQSSQ
jgi:hypothetical protein